MFQCVHIGGGGLRKFTNNSLMPPEQFFYPSSLAFGERTIHFYLSSLSLISDKTYFQTSEKLDKQKQNYSKIQTRTEY